jgi:glucose-1-phosphate cytidylyltransferase
MSDVTFDISNNEMIVHRQKAEPWKVTLVDTGSETMTGGRLKRVHEYIKDEKCFCFTYGDGLSNVNIKKSIEVHDQNPYLVTVTAVAPPGRYGAILYKGNQVKDFTEKPAGDGGLINGGFFVLSPEVIKYIQVGRENH